MGTTAATLGVLNDEGNTSGCAMPLVRDTGTADGKESSSESDSSISSSSGCERDNSYILCWPIKHGQRLRESRF